ncbi:hypothetical protein BH24ACI5_BH24ACI5_22480 [soil metagenome]
MCQAVADTGTGNAGLKGRRYSVSVGATVRRNRVGSGVTAAPSGGTASGPVLPASGTPSDAGARAFQAPISYDFPKQYSVFSVRR